MRKGQQKDHIPEPKKSSGVLQPRIHAFVAVIVLFQELILFAFAHKTCLVCCRCCVFRSSPLYRSVLITCTSHTHTAHTSPSRGPSLPLLFLPARRSIIGGSNVFYRRRCRKVQRNDHIPTLVRCTCSCHHVYKTEQFNPLGYCEHKGVKRVEISRCAKKVPLNLVWLVTFHRFHTLSHSGHRFYSEHWTTREC